MTFLRSVRFASVVFVSLVIGCAAPTEGETIAATTSPIQGGEAETGSPAVGLLLFTDGGYCSGTLIAPNVVLTAGHCVVKTLASFITTNGTVDAVDRHAISETRAFPGFSFTKCPNPSRDIGLVRLAEPITDIAPVAFGDAPPAVGTSCTAVGFGRHNTETGVLERMKKRSATSTIDQVVGNSVRVAYESGIADSGDSGGPLICGGSVVATVSCHTDGSGTSHRLEYYQRVDEATAWAASTITDWTN